MSNLFRIKVAVSAYAIVLFVFHNFFFSDSLVFDGKTFYFVVCDTKANGSHFFMQCNNSLLNISIHKSF